jgi:hypothetical protein
VRKILTVTLNVNAIVSVYNVSNLNSAIASSQSVNDRAVFTALSTAPQPADQFVFTITLAQYQTYTSAQFSLSLTQSISFTAALQPITLNQMQITFTNGGTHITPSPVFQVVVNGLNATVQNANIYAVSIPSSY